MAAHSATVAGDGRGEGEGDVDRRRRTRGWHNERTERGNATTSWARLQRDSATARRHTAFLYSVVSIDAEGRTFNDGN